MLRRFLIIWLCAGLLFTPFASVKSSIYADDVSEDLSAPGPYLEGWADVSVTFSAIEEGAAINRTIQARVYYPALAPGGQNAALDPTGGPYPGIAFGHGYVQPITRYASTTTHLATWGFIVIATKSQGGPLPSHSQYADELIATLNWLEAQHGQASSRFFQNVDIAHFGISGHSMGGGASLLAADRDPSIVAVANLAAAQTNPSAIAAMAAITAPVLLVAGSEDSITPPNQHQAPMYNNGSAPRQLALIQGGFHCGFQDSGPRVGCDRGSISRAAQLTITRRLLTAWFLLYLKGDVARWETVWGPGLATDPQVTYTIDDGIGLSPKTQSGATPAGQLLNYTMMVTNTDTVATSFALAVQSGWAAGTSVSTIGPLAPGAGASVMVWVTPPVSGQQTLTLTVTSLADGGTTDWATMTTTSTP